MNIRPIYHQNEQRAEAHILIAFLACCFQVTLTSRLMIHAPGLTAPAVLEKLATIPIVEVWIPSLDPGWLILPATRSWRETFRLFWIRFTSTFLLYRHNPASKRLLSRRPLSRNRRLTQFCGEGLSGAPTDSQGLIYTIPRELRESS